MPRTLVKRVMISSSLILMSRRADGTVPSMVLAARSCNEPSARLTQPFAGRLRPDILRPSFVDLASAIMNAIETQPSNGTVLNHGKGNFMGSALIDKITPKTFRQFAAAAVDFLKINSIEEKFRHGKPVIIKRRNGASEQIAESANLFFRLAEIPIRFWSKIEDWQRWEVDCFQLLNGDHFRAFKVRDNSVCVEKVPGQSLWDHMVESTLSRQMMEAA